MSLFKPNQIALNGGHGSSVSTNNSPLPSPYLDSFDGLQMKLSVPPSLLSDLSLHYLMIQKTVLKKTRSMRDAGTMVVRRSSRVQQPRFVPPLSPSLVTLLVSVR